MSYDNHQRPAVKRNRKLSAPPPKPCPTCHAPMTAVKDGWVCEKHGAPTKK